MHIYGCASVFSLPAPLLSQSPAPDFHFCFPGSRLVQERLGFSLARPRGPKMTRAADIQWLPGVITDVYSAWLCWTVSLLKGALPRAAQVTPARGKGHGCCPGARRGPAAPGPLRVGSEGRGKGPTTQGSRAASRPASPSPPLPPPQRPNRHSFPDRKLNLNCETEAILKETDSTFYYFSRENRFRLGRSAPPPRRSGARGPRGALFQRKSFPLNPRLREGERD